MQLTPLVRAGGPAPARHRWSLVASVALHVVLVAVIVFLYARPRPLSENDGPDYQLIFDTAPASPTAAPAASTPTAPQSASVPMPEDTPIGPPAPPPTAPPSPDAVSVPPPAPAAAAPDQPATPAAPRLAFAPPAAPAPEDAPPPPASTSEPPTAEPAVTAAPETPPETPSVRLASPDGELPLPLDTTPIMPVRPPPLPPLPTPPRPTPRPVAPRSAPVGTLSRPMDLSFGGASRPPPAARLAIGPRALDLRVPTQRVSTTADPYADIRAANASATWNNGLQRYWNEHRYFPSQAIDQGEQGTVTVELTVARSGRVEEVRLVSSSGSQWLDMAAISTWRDARLRPFTDEMHEDRLTFPISIHYILVGR